jgi:hypothetical protein
MVSCINSPFLFRFTQNIPEVHKGTLGVGEGMPVKRVGKKREKKVDWQVRKEGGTTEKKWPEK